MGGQWTSSLCHVGSDFLLLSDFANRVDEEYSAASLNTCVQIGRILKARLEAIEVSAESPLHGEEYATIAGPALT